MFLPNSIGRFFMIACSCLFTHSAIAAIGVPKNCLEDIYSLARVYNSTSARLQAGEISESFGQLYLSTTYQSSLNRAKICSEHEKVMEERSPLGVYTQIQYLQLSQIFGTERAEAILSFLGLPTQTNLQQRAQSRKAAILSYFDELIFESHSQLAWER